ncbi:MAG TPA: MMPL family transporter [Solimonas sp.]|nr:MMPL family transporter [Solimonas sp.]
MAHGDSNGRFARLFLKLTLPIVFGNRKLTLAVIGLMTLFMGYHAAQLRLDAGFSKQLPIGHPYIETFNKYQKDFGGANTVLFALLAEDGKGDVFQPKFMESLRVLTQAVFFTPGIDRARVSSVFTPDVRYLETIEGGFQGGNVIPAEYAPTPEMMEQIRGNVAKAKVIGRYVANDQRGAMVFSELVETNPVTGEKLDYFETAALIEEVRHRIISPKMYEYRLKADHLPLKAGEVVLKGYVDPRGLMFRFKAVKVESRDDEGQSSTHLLKGADFEIAEVDNPDFNPDVDVKIVGFAKVVGDIGDAVLGVVGFFALTIFLVWLILWWYCSSPVIALLPLSCGILAVIWELGILQMAGYGLDPFAILVPFLVLAISVSHGIQITSFWLLEIATRGSNSFDASRNTYKRLVIPGITALLTNVVGFGTILLIPVGIIREMAINAMFGLVAVIVCKKILLPCLLSYAKLRDPEGFRRKQVRRDASLDRVWRGISVVTRRPVAAVLLLAAGGVWIGAEYIARDLKYGELHAGVPELRPSSRYNLDSQAIVDNFSIGVDVIKVIAEGKENGCIDHATMAEIDRFEWRMQGTPGVQSTLSLAQAEKGVFQAYNEGNPKFWNLPREADGLVLAGQQFPTSSGLLNKDCSAVPVLIFTTDHKAETIDTVVAAVKQFIGEQKPDAPVKFQLATGNVGVMAATNDTVRVADHKVLMWLFVCIAVCVWLSFPGISGLVCVLVPLAAVSVFTYAVMVFLDIGVTVSTLPVAAFAAGIGVDYGIYIYSILEENVKVKGMALREAYVDTLHQTGKAVVVTALALAASVCTWMLSDLQFQINMGILLTIMFLANAMAAVLLLPAFAAFLLGRKAPVTQPQAEVSVS